MTNFPDGTEAIANQASPPNHGQIASSGSSTHQPDLGQPYLQIENICKSFGQFTALNSINLNVYVGEFVCLLGPSGCGKTTLLRIIAGLEQQSSGRIIQGGKDVSRLPPAKRDFGIVFQSYALFPNLTATQNIAYGLENTPMPKRQIEQRVKELLETVGLEGFGQKYPSQMSGGQQQRIALARALALSPSLLLLDEPLSALDAKVRNRLRVEITQLQKRLGVTTVMVTHDQEEALTMSDRVVVMDKGVIAQVGTPRVVYQSPKTPFVANFIGATNLLTGEVVSSTQVRCGNIVLEAKIEDLEINSQIAIAIRPEAIHILDGSEQNENLPNVISADIEGIEFLGSVYHLTLRPDGNAKVAMIIEISIYKARQIDLNLGTTLKIQLPANELQIFPSRS
ncbi:MAG: putative 2-aminoethylphosphonate ABC transporter ATP-binding protein [Pseudanabaena sp.]|jgi:iron(III) transport system ATP-binding protein|uniref:putative 2-aminoethylphosphonate ABC transporter ATP-binding protein n=1 Tax=Pseudanabaena mucicola TaxID=71190 RepID=UPI002574A7F2|nr:putative 2-aminoethylphosphonate ABC transporter ATP-binding protein [Pseudanabaena mucicola]MCA6586246.1 putative 2-aminoethylphosphonate ABC transporter ATP-binding protein [Pseudanabaena sp. M051S1SP1A06QC]MCA6588705.1 putative 2-aminoethylphosphonate ABC transporter ATP-binding protein [Pseudanabaena sp. M109S1SP1A06QC]MCA6598098.1 putative 2-aminoethylphosphonate ABC transporter ATP-binding protein [Pseudanabaena sp. M046S1SP1A06QC]MCA6604861.1 putative 2-aminoethylphosphonate ABC trans